MQVGGIWGVYPLVDNSDQLPRGQRGACRCMYSLANISAAYDLRCRARRVLLHRQGMYLVKLHLSSPSPLKLTHVHRAGGSHMFLAHDGDDALFQMASLEWTNLPVVALTIRRADIDVLFASSTVHVLHAHSVSWQCFSRMQRFVDMNSPRASVDVFYDCAPHFELFNRTNLSQLLQPSKETNSEVSAFYSQVVALYDQSVFKSSDSLSRITLASAALAVQFAAHPSGADFVALGVAALNAGLFAFAVDCFAQVFLRESEAMITRQARCGQVPGGLSSRGLRPCCHSLRRLAYDLSV